MPQEGTNPYIGKTYEIWEKVEETRIEDHSFKKKKI